MIKQRRTLWVIIKMIKIVPNMSVPFIIYFDPPGHSRIGGHYFHTWCLSVRQLDLFELYFLEHINLNLKGQYIYSYTRPTQSD